MLKTAQWGIKSSVNIRQWTSLSSKYVSPFRDFRHILSRYTGTNFAEKHVRNEKPTDNRQLDLLKLEADNAYREGRRVPPLEFFTANHWNHILQLPSKSQRVKFYEYLWLIEKKRFSQTEKKKERQIANENRQKEWELANAANDHITYGLFNTTMFLRIYDTAINRWQNNRLSRAMQFAPKLVLDCSYDDFMTNREALNAAKQLMLCFADNRANTDPFDLHYCNVNLNNACSQALLRYIPSLLDPDFPVNVSQKNFTEIFPKENIVYLTPHCRTDLREYNPDDVYIIGAMVDKSSNEAHSLAKARKQKLRMARLPLDINLDWAAGSGKSLTLNQIVKIMLDLKNTGSWETALRHVPRRKLASFPRYNR